MGAGKTGAEGFKNTIGGRITQHGAQRIRERGFTDAELAHTKQTNDIRTQADGAKVYVREISPGRFNVLVEGERGPITVFKNIKQGSLDRLSRNYGWR